MRYGGRWLLIGWAAVFDTVVFTGRQLVVMGYVPKVEYRDGRYPVYVVWYIHRGEVFQYISPCRHSTSHSHIKHPPNLLLLL